jgi:hypothetical protein
MSGVEKYDPSEWIGLFAFLETNAITVDYR